MCHYPRKALAIACFALVSWVGAAIDATNTGASVLDTLQVDVCVIGGGAAGTYAAIKAHDMNKTVVVVEMQERLGGHTKTYIDPVSKQPIELGVQEYDNTTLVENWFARFNISTYSFNFTIPGVTSEFVDFQSGQIANHTAPLMPAAIEEYRKQLTQYPSLDYSLDNGSFLVPPDLLLPLGQFISKYGLQGAMPLFGLYGQGWGNFVTLPTLYAIKYFTQQSLQAQTQGSLATKDNSRLYERAQTELGAKALLSSTVLHMDRSAADFANITVQTPSGRKLIRARKIISTIPPVLENLRGFDLNETEIPIFGKFRYHSWYVGLLNNSGIPDNITLFNYGLKNTENFNLGVLPAAYDIYTTRVAGLHYFTFGLNDSETQFSQHQVETNIKASITQMQAKGTLPKPLPGSANLDMLNFTGHTPYEVQVSSEEIGNGFYNRLFCLQGQRNTYWTGAAFVTHNSAAIWNYTDKLVNSMWSDGA